MDASVFFIDPEWTLGIAIDASKYMTILMALNFYKQIIFQKVSSLIIIISLCYDGNYVIVWFCGYETVQKVELVPVLGGIV